MHKLSPAIRKAAILVSSLDEPAADALLAQMGDETAARVRSALVELHDIPAEERKAVLADFLAGQHAADSSGPADTGVEVQIGSVAEKATPADAVAEQLDSTQPQPFAFLHLFPPLAIAQVLSRETAQTIAAVIAHLEPQLAARILETMSASLATEALERMASLRQPSAEVLSDVADHLRRMLARENAPKQSNHSLAATQDVLAAMNPETRDRLMSGLRHRSGLLAEQAGCGLDRAASERLRYRVESSDTAHLAASSERRARSAPLVEFEDLLSLSDSTLRRVFAAADPSVVLLALTGAPESLLARIFSQLPPNQAATLRKRLGSPGPVRLSDIAAAQEALADIARRLAETGAILLAHSRHFAAAA